MRRRPNAGRRGDKMLLHLRAATYSRINKPGETKQSALAPLREAMPMRRAIEPPEIKRGVMKWYVEPP